MSYSLEGPSFLHPLPWSPRLATCDHSEHCNVVVSPRKALQSELMPRTKRSRLPDWVPLGRVESGESEEPSMAGPSRVSRRWMAPVPRLGEVHPDPAARGTRELGAPLVPPEAAHFVREGCEAGAGGALAWGAIRGSGLPNRWVFGAVDSTTAWRVQAAGEQSFAVTCFWVANTENER